MAIAQEINSDYRQQLSVLAHPFRVFFLATAIYAMLAVSAWIAFLFGGWPLPLGWAPLQWHSHEMLYGFVTAAIAGFVLTAMCNWTGAPPLQGFRLLLLMLLWAAGRLAMWFAQWLPSWLVIVLDLSFLPLVAGYVAAILLRYNNKRNLILVAVLTLLFAGNLLMHLGFASGKSHLLKLGQLIGFDVITVLIVIIAGRITPAFSANWLRVQGRDPELVKRFPRLEMAALGSVLLLLLTELVRAPANVVAGIALVAGLLNGLRLALWRGWSVWREPLLWVLHVGYGWLVLALVLRALSGFIDALSPSLWQHALGMGAIGILILGVMTRVAVGHTGRPLRLFRLGLCAYFAVIGAALIRVLTAAGLVDFRLGISVSAVAWVVAFALFLVSYGPVLASPRADGRSG